MKRLAYAAGLVLALVGIDAAQAEAKEGACQQATPDTFVIDGVIDAALTACVEQAFAPTTSQLILTSRGGKAGEAMRIAEWFEGRRLTMTVKGECNSSCANYFLPLAGRLIVEPGAVIVVHGGIDPSLISRQLAPDGDMAEPGVDLAPIAEQQRAFVARNGINPGWLLYREADSLSVERLDGALADFDARTKAWLVEETMARSCLPNTVVEYRADRRGEWLTESRRRALRRQNIARSNTVVCN
ncbi:hypothetical protein [Brevundimonas sp.]|uniref:hypothetical protein n=1 Tax=Brevundimonas sp. TaxID=1871086 RepID=UPI0035675950